MMGVEAMKSIDPRTVDRSTLMQRSSVRLDPSAPREERLRDFIQQIKNPYCYLDGKTVEKDIEIESKTFEAASAKEALDNNTRAY